MKLNSICIHGAGKTNRPDGAVSAPIYQSATFSHIGVGQSTGYDYSRLSNPTRTELETIVMKLEHGYDALAFTSGMAAITATMELFAPGDHILASDDIYGGSYRLFEHISKKNGITVEFVNTSDPKAVATRIQRNTKAIFVETPTNPMMHVADIRRLSVITKAKDLVLIVDNTFLSPYFQNPLLLGANIVIHSGTKYLCGHNDTLAGFVVVDTKALSERLRFIFKTTGACLAPFDSWLLIRGIKTLGIRMEKQQENAMRVAKWLERHEKVKRVHYAGLTTHPDYIISASQARGFGAMISFEVDCKETALQLLERVEMILFAESLGGVESLITYPMMQTHGDIPQDIRERLGISESLLRISVGIEDIDDILEDLGQALS